MTATRAPWRDQRITLKHGAGGHAMRQLIEDILAAGLQDMPVNGFGLSAMDDGAALRIGDQWLVITTDSYVVHPLFFPGGDIGRLAISGTINDLAMMGATEPLGLTSAVIVEEGFPRADLERIQRSMLDTCQETGVPVVTGDTKVMGRGELDGIVINTTGLALARGIVRDNGLRPGDQIILTGSMGDHGMALMALRHRLAIEAELRSDVAPINTLVREALRAAGGSITAMKDPTRGGVASALHEMAAKSGVGVVVREAAVPISPSVRSVADLLGLDPFHIANEGKAIIGIAPARAAAVLAAIRAHALGREAAIVGECTAEHAGRIVLDTGLGRRLLTEPEGEPLPRIC
jgi:hydrogenase expression/formation protein HypE